MNKMIPLFLGIALIALGSTSCATSGKQSPPTALDRTLFDIKTTQQTNVVTITQTNLVTLTNVDHQVITQTNLQYILREEVQTNYLYVPRAAITDTVGVVAPLAGPWGAVAGAIASGALGLFAFFKNKQASTADAVAGAATQAIATARQVISSMPNGSSVASKFDAFLLQHHSDLDLAKEVAGYVDKYVDPHAANGAAASIIAAASTPIQRPATQTIIGS